MITSSYSRSTPEELKRAQEAVDLAVRCGVNSQYAYDYINSNSTDMTRATAAQAARDIMVDYQNAVQTAKLDWGVFRHLVKGK